MTRQQHHRTFSAERGKQSAHRIGIGQGHRSPWRLDSPRGVADATIGGFADIMRQADLVVLLGKALDFTVRWLEPPVAAQSVAVIVLDPDGALVARAAREKGERLLIGAVADSMLAAKLS